MFNMWAQFRLNIHAATSTKEQRGIAGNQPRAMAKAPPPSPRWIIAAKCPLRFRVVHFTARLPCTLLNEAFASPALKSAFRLMRGRSPCICRIEFFGIRCGEDE
jgi:hypothetical protein